MYRRMLIVLFVSLLIAAAMPVAAGIIYLKIANDPNPGSITVQVRSVSSTTPVYSATLAPNQSTGIQTPTVASGSYVVSFNWSNTNFHNINASTGNMIATCNPPTGACAVSSWQAAGTGVFASIPVKVP